MNIIKINGRTFPSPDNNLNLVVTTIVNASRNANGRTVGQKLSRDNYKLDGLTWSYLDSHTWSELLKEFDKFYIEVEFPDMVNNCMRTLTMYVGDRTATPFEISPSGLPTSYRNCKCNIIDVGA